MYFSLQAVQRNDPFFGLQKFCGKLIYDDDDDDDMTGKTSPWINIIDNALEASRTEGQCMYENDP